MPNTEKGFTLIELIAVIILIGIMSVTLFSRLGSVGTANLQASRDDIIAALFFAQQTAMARSNIQFVITSNSVSVTENGAPIVVHSKGYPLTLASGVTASLTLASGSPSSTLTYDKLGRTTAATIGLSSSSGASASIVVEASGYAH